MNAGIYKILCSANNKVYIGQAKDVYARWRGHRYALTRGIHVNQHLQNAWGKYGAAAFSFTVAQWCVVEDLGRLEIIHLDAVPEQLRLNIGPAGDNPTAGVAKTQGHKEKQSRAMGGLPFFAKHMLTGEVTRHTLRSDLVGFNKAHVGACLRGDRKSHNGYEFFYDYSALTEYVKPAKAPKRPPSRAVVSTCIATGEETLFARVVDTKAAGFHRGLVTQCLAGERAETRGHTWRYADGLPHKHMSEQQRERLLGFRTRGGSRPVEGVDLDGVVQCCFPYIRAAAVALGVTSAAISHSLAGKQKAGGLYWRYAEKERAPG